MKKIGRVGKANLVARQKIAEICEYEQLTRCLLRFDVCTGEANDPAHRHPRVWYRRKPELLYDKKQWIEACRSCHYHLDNVLSAEESENVFMKIRGEE